MTETAIVLPPKEGFSAGAVGAIGLLVHRLVRAGADGVVLGRACAEPFADVRFEPVRPGLGFSRAGRYAAGVAAAVRRLWPGLPKLIEVHNWPEIALRLVRTGVPVTLILNNDPQGMRGAKTAAERAVLLGRLAGVACASEWLRGRMLDGVSGTVAVLHNCIDLPPPPNPARDRLILFAGRMVADKGADVFVAACAQALPGLPGWRAEMIGADRFSPDSPETPFLRALRPAAAAAGIVLRGHQPNAVVLEAMGRAAIVAVPSRWAEPFGLVALEAMAAGAVVVHSRRGGLPEVVGDTGVVVDPEAPADWATAFYGIGGDDRWRGRMSAAGRARAEGFGAGAAAERLLEWRHHVLGAKPSPDPLPAGEGFC